MATETSTGTTTATDPAVAAEPGVSPATAEAAGGEVTAGAAGAAERAPAKKTTTTRRRSAAKKATAAKDAPAKKRSAAKKATASQDAPANKSTSSAKDAPAKKRTAAKKSTASAGAPKATAASRATAGDASAAPATVAQPAEPPAAEQTMIDMPLAGAETATGSADIAEGAGATAEGKQESAAPPQAALDAASSAPVAEPAAEQTAAQHTAPETAPAKAATGRRTAARRAATAASATGATAKGATSEGAAAKGATAKGATSEGAAGASATTPTAATKPAARKAATKNAAAGRPAATKASAASRSSRPGQSPKPKVVPPAPRLPRSGKTVVDGRGEPIVGARHGSPEIIDWSALAEHHRPNRLTRIRKHRRWVYATASTDQYLVALAVADVGPMGTAFVMVTDLTTGEVIADSSRPGAVKPLVHVSYEPREGLTARYRLPGTEYDIHRERGSKETRVRVSLRRTHDSLPGLRSLPGISRVPLVRDLPTASHRPWLDIDLTLEEGAAPHLTAVSPVLADGGLVTSTVKTAAMPAWGTVTVHQGEATRVITMDGGTGGIDYTNGFLPRHTSWRWAYSTGRLGDGRLFGINLVSGFSGIGDDAWENALWLDGALIPLPSEARIMCDEDDLMAPWTIRTVDGSVHLRFQPRAIHAENVNIGVFRGSLKQPTGSITGHVMVDGQRIVVSDLAAVVEDQDYLW